MSRYAIFIIPSARDEMRELPGNMRQRIKREIRSLENEPRPAKSKTLAVPDFEIELRRLRINRYRVVYSIVENEQNVDILAVRKRPPYDYGDIEKLLEEIK